MDIGRASARVFVANVIGNVIMFLGLMFFARELGATRLGIFFLFQALLAILQIPADFGIQGAAEKRISEGVEPPEMLTMAAVLKSVPLLTIVVGILLFRNLINSYFGAELAVLLAVGLVLQDFGRLMVRVLQGEFRVGETAVLHLAHKVVWIGTSSLLVVAGFGVHGLVYGLLLGFSVRLVWGFGKRSTPFGTPSRKHAESLIAYAKYNLISSIGGSFYSWLDVTILGLFLSQMYVGAYESAWQVTSVTLLFGSAIATSIFPKISEWDTNEQSGEIETAIRDAFTPALIFVIPAFFGTVVLARDILRIAFGTEFALAWLPFIILMGEKVFQSFHLIIGRSLQAIDRPDLAAKATIASLASNIVLNFLLIWSFGIVGAAVATALSSLLNTALHYRYLSRFVSIEFPVRKVSWCLVAAGCMTVAIVPLRSNMEIASMLDLGVVIAAGAIVYGAVVLVSQSVRQQMMDFIPLSATRSRTS